LEIENLADFDQRAGRSGSLVGWTVQSVDLSGRGAVLAKLTVQGALFLGCRFDTGVEQSLIDRGAFVFPTLPGPPFNPYRPGLYTAGELYTIEREAAGLLAGHERLSVDEAVRRTAEEHDDRRYTRTTDGRIYAWYTAQPTPTPVAAGLAMSLHDNSILEALADRLTPQARVVGVMGGHGTVRGEPDYRLAVELGVGLAAAGFTVASGGGPGAMEAANLGSRLVASDVASALDQLATVPDYSPDVMAWADVALALLPALRPTFTLGIPTWYYGHEPPNVFASGIAKLFSNAIREDLLLATCRAGLVYLPGAAGTVQEVFQAATRDYYAPDPALITPLVFLGRDYWTTTVPVWGLISALARGRAMAQRLYLVDSVDEALDALS